MIFADAALAPVPGKLAEPQAVLEQVFGYREFRPGQRKIIDAVLSGRDCIGVMPTGAGKSLTFQVPAKILPGTVLVISPLISLMKDQVDAVTRLGFSAAVINSTLDLDERGRRLALLRRGAYDLLYVAPEGLEGSLRRLIATCPISLVVVDEAHCISHWGHDFRPAYRQLQDLKAQLGDIPVLALTATATRRDILGMIRSRRGESGIVYCLSRKAVDSLTAWLRQQGIAALPYHAGLEDEERARNQDAFARDEAEVIVATVAFGMGIDKSNVRYVIHRDMPKSIEAYYQEIGRAGRDGLPSDCVVLYSWADVIGYRAFLQDLEDPVQAAETDRKTVELFRLFDRGGCRHRAVVGYFDEAIEPCGESCDVCRGTTIEDLIRVVATPVGKRGAAASHLALGTAEPDRAFDPELFERLRALRRKLADAEGVPAYIVFSDAVLRQMAQYAPRNESELLALSGVGPAKLQRYGDAFLDVLREA